MIWFSSQPLPLGDEAAKLTNTATRQLFRQRERAARGLARQPSQYSNKHQPLPGVGVEEAANTNEQSASLFQKREGCPKQGRKQPSKAGTTQS